MNCRHCRTPLALRFLDLGTAPPSNAFLRVEDLARPEAWYPLELYVCSNCRLVQTRDLHSAEQIFSADYVYFSSYSSSWLEHAARYVEAVSTRLGLGPQSRVVEVASNDGYLLKNFVARGVPCLGIEPTASTAAAARAIGVPTREVFFGAATAEEIRDEFGPADLIVGNNVYAHVPDINDFTAGLARLLAPDGVITLEFPHLYELVRQHQFDTVYHEHYSYLSLLAVERILAAQGLRVFDVEQLPTHGGSLRVWIAHRQGPHRERPGLGYVRDLEAAVGIADLDYYRGFQTIAEQVKYAFLRFLLEERSAGRRVVAYGAAAKGNTLLNFAGVRADLLAYVVDRSPHKQGRYLPGARIPVVAEERLERDRPETIVILPWNLADEIAQQLAYTRDWGARLYVAIPRLRALE